MSAFPNPKLYKAESVSEGTYSRCGEHGNSSEYDETTWSARSFMAFAAQRISVAVQLSMAQEVAEALGLSVAADPRAT